MLSLEDELAVKFLPQILRKLLVIFGLRGAGQLLRLAQYRQQQSQASARSNVLRADRQLDELLAFGGRKQ